MCQALLILLAYYQLYLTTTLCRYHCFPHFADEKNEAEQLSNLVKNTQLTNKRQSWDVNSDSLDPQLTFLTTKSYIKADVKFKFSRLVL